MNGKKIIEINTSIFPCVMKFRVSEPLPRDLKDEELEKEAIHQSQSPNIEIELPRGANLLYLSKIAEEHSTLEIRLLEQYANGMPFSDSDYDELLKMIMTPVNRNWTNGNPDDLLTPFGVKISNDDNGSQKFSLIEDAIPAIKAETWECIILDHLKQAALDVISCFDFDSKIKYNLRAWKSSTDNSEQSLNTALRTAFMFTLVAYCFGDVKNQYRSFSDFFDAEYFKRVSLVYGVWHSSQSKDTVKYIPLYDSFYNLTDVNKTDLIKILRAILDDEEIAFDERQELKNRLIEGAGEFHCNISEEDKALEQNLIKPTVNFILLREKAKETLETAELLCDNRKYTDCANRCYYAMMFSLKVLLENKGLLAKWKKGELKESETHESLENGLKKLIGAGILSNDDKAAFDYVKDQRWKCDYSLYKFEKTDAENCVKKARDFYEKVEMITTLG